MIIKYKMVYNPKMELKAQYLYSCIYSSDTNVINQLKVVQCDKLVIALVNFSSIK